MKITEIFKDFNYGRNKFESVNNLFSCEDHAEYDSFPFIYHAFQAYSFCSLSINQNLSQSTENR